MANSPEELQYLIRKYPRHFGALYIFAGVVSSYLTIILPIQQAEAGATEVYVTYKGIILSVILLLMGLPFVIFGSHCTPVRNKTLLYVILAIVVAVAIGSVALVVGWLVSKGYQIR
jgi:hypothetical protein